VLGEVARRQVLDGRRLERLVAVLGGVLAAVGGAEELLGQVARLLGGQAAVGAEGEAASAAAAVAVLDQVGPLAGRLVTQAEAGQLVVEEDGVPPWPGKQVDGSLEILSIVVDGEVDQAAFLRGLTTSSRSC
jgi:hypothetical protein